MRYHVIAVDPLNYDCLTDALNEYAAQGFRIISVNTAGMMLIYTLACKVK